MLSTEPCLFAKKVDPQQVKWFQWFTSHFIYDSDNDDRLANVLTYFIVFAVTAFPYDIHFPDNFMQMNNQSTLWRILSSSTYTVLNKQNLLFVINKLLSRKDSCFLKYFDKYNGFTKCMIHESKMNVAFSYEYIRIFNRYYTL